MQHLPAAMPPARRFFSISTEFLAFNLASLLLISGVLLLVVQKDLDFAREAIEGGQAPPFRQIAVEIAFVLGVVATGCLVVTRSLARNLRMIHDLQLRAMESVTAGNYACQVPVVRNDELGLIAGHTNQMIEALREKQRVQDAFGKLVSPAVAEAILAEEEGAALRGRRVEAVVLFTDLRNFTGLSESTEPEGVVSLLNEYFTMLVQAVYAQDGILDKFIGDAAMAVFGLEGREDASDRAFQAALAIHEGLAGVNERLQARGLPALAQGIGLHQGPLIAGTIGSQDRMEYTVIGDTVNLASRLEGLCKTVGAHLLVSNTVYASLSEGGRSHLVPRGLHQVKGRAEGVEVYGLASGGQQA